MREASVVGLTSSRAGRAASAKYPAVAGPKRRQNIGALVVAHLSRGHHRRWRFGLLAAGAGCRVGSGRFRQIDPQAAVLRENRGALDHVLQFAHIAGPVVARQPPRIAFRQSQVGFQFLALAGQEVLRQQRNVLAAVAQAAPTPPETR